MPTNPHQQPIPLRTIRTTIRLTVDEVASIAAYQREHGHGSVSSAVRELLVRGLRGGRNGGTVNPFGEG